VSKNARRDQLADVSSERLSPQLPVVFTMRAQSPRSPRPSTKRARWSAATTVLGSAHRHLHITICDDCIS